MGLISKKTFYVHLAVFKLQLQLHRPHDWHVNRVNQTG